MFTSKVHCGVGVLHILRICSDREVEDILAKRIVDDVGYLEKSLINERDDGQIQEPLTNSLRCFSDSVSVKSLIRTNLARIRR